MAWKTERWLDELFPGPDRIYSAYRHLSGRELVIVACAVLDVALGELLQKRLIDNAPESETFLGVNGDGRAPVATFGSRIQLALLVGLITREDAAVLRHLKSLRNTLSHRVNVDLCSDHALRSLRALLAEWKALTSRLAERQSWPTPRFDEIEDCLGRLPEAAEGLVLAVFSTYHALFHRLSDRVVRVGMVT